MTRLVCPECDKGQNVPVTVDTYYVRCEHCGNQFDVPREHRKNKKLVQEDASVVNIRVGWTPDGDTLKVAYTVQSAEKHNQYMEREVVSVDVSQHPQKLYWYVAVFKMLQKVSEYKSARIWIKDDGLVKHLSGDVNISDNDLRENMRQQIIKLSTNKFLGVEYCTNQRTGKDIKQLLK